MLSFHNYCDLLFSYAWMPDLLDFLRQKNEKKIYLVGSVVRHLLDHTLEDIRDIDLYLIAPSCTLNLVEDYADSLIKSQIFKNKSVVKSKIRAQQNLPLPERNQYQIGWGVHLYPKLQHHPILSLNVAYSLGDLSLNGLFDIDTLMIPIQLTGHKTMSLALIDPYHGQDSWQKKKPKLVHWAEYQRAYPRHGLRVARTLVRCGLVTLTQDQITWFKSKKPRVDYYEKLNFEFYRDLAKVFRNHDWIHVLRICIQLEIFLDIPPLQYCHKMIRDKVYPMPQVNHYSEEFDRITYCFDKDVRTHELLFYLKEAMDSI